MFDDEGAGSGDHDPFRHRRNDIPPPMPTGNRTLQRVHGQTPLGQIIEAPGKKLHVERCHERFLLFRHKSPGFFFVTQQTFAVKIPQECLGIGRKALVDGLDFRRRPESPHAQQGQACNFSRKGTGKIKSQESAHGPADQMYGFKMVLSEKSENFREGSGGIQWGVRSYPGGELFRQVEHLAGKSPAGQEKEGGRQWRASLGIVYPTLRHHCSGINGLIPECILVLQKPTVDLFNPLPQRDVRLPTKLGQF